MMASCVKKEIVVQTIMNAEVPYYAIIVDGARDKNNHEAISVYFHYVNDGTPRELLFTTENVDSLKAKFCAVLILRVLYRNGIDHSRMLSQFYDGASVMSGRTGGVQTLICEILGREIPYVNCFNHQLHLIVITVLSEILECKHFFEYTRIIRKLFSRFTFKKFYQGGATKCLLETRWPDTSRCVKLFTKTMKKC